MNPVVGLDVSKGESQVQAFLDKGYQPSVVLESTGHYHGRYSIFGGAKLCLYRC